MVRLRRGGRSIRELVDLIAIVTGRGLDKTNHDVSTAHGLKHDDPTFHSMPIVRKPSCHVQSIYAPTTSVPTWRVMHPHDTRTGAIVNTGSFEDKRDDDISFVGTNNKCIATMWKLGHIGKKNLINARDVFSVLYRDRRGLSRWNIRNMLENIK